MEAIPLKIKKHRIRTLSDIVSMIGREFEIYLNTWEDNTSYVFDDEKMIINGEGNKKGRQRGEEKR